MIYQPNFNPLEHEIMQKLDTFASNLTFGEATHGFWLEDIFVRAGITSTFQQTVFNRWSPVVKDYLRQCGWKRRFDFYDWRLKWYPPVIAAPSRPALTEAEPRQGLPKSAHSDPPALQPAQKKMSYRELLASQSEEKPGTPRLSPRKRDNPTELH